MKKPDLKHLSEPFRDDEIEWRIQRSGLTKKGGVWAMVVPYAAARAVMNRLDEAVGIENWRADYENITMIRSYRGQDGKVLHEEHHGISCSLFLRLPVGDSLEWVDKSDVSDLRRNETVKASRSDALKRAAVQWGIGRDLYNVERGIFAIVSDKGKNYATHETKDGKKIPFNWDPPPIDSVRKGTAPKPEKDKAPVAEDAEIVIQPSAARDELLKAVGRYVDDDRVSAQMRGHCRTVLNSPEKFADERIAKMVETCAKEAAAPGTTVTDADVPFAGDGGLTPQGDTVP